MINRLPLIAVAVCLGSGVVSAQDRGASAPRRITLREAVDMALQHNHVVRLARLSVEEKEHAKEVARSAYFPLVRTEAGFLHLTDTQFIGIPAGGLGSVGTALIPSREVTLNQGSLNTATSGTGAVQPLTQLLKIRAANDVARAEVDAASGKSRGVENSIALRVHQVYYRILIAEVRRGAAQSKIEAAEALQRERVQQVAFGAALDAEVIESRAAALQATQELLTTELQLSDLHMQFNDAVGLPLSTSVTLDPNVAGMGASCTSDECVKAAVETHPEVAEARALVDKAASAQRLARYEFVPDVEAFARYSFQNNVPFLANHFGTVGVRLSYDLFEGGRRNARIRERTIELAQAKENLARISEDIELRVQTARNKLERTRRMVAVSEELLALRSESRRVAGEQLARGSALRSQARSSVAQEFDAKAALLQSQLDYVQAVDEMDEALGRMPQQ